MTTQHRAVLIGCGAMSGAWFKILRDHFAARVELVGLVDLNLQAAQKRAAEFGLEHARLGASLEEVLRETRPGVVFNCTVPPAHVPTCETAFRAGCAVLVEKPLAPTVAEGRHLVQAAAEAGVLVAVIQNRRYLPGALAVRRALVDGLIGPVRSLHADFFLAPRFGGFRETMEHPLLLDMAVHTFDQARQLSGLDARRVTCHEFNPAGSWYAHGATATALFEMEGDAVFTYRGSWCARGFPTSWAGSWRIVGEKGTLLWDGEERIEVERIDGTWDGKSFTEPVERLTLPPMELEPRQQGHAGNIGEFLDALDAGTAPQTVATDNLRTVAMVEAAIQSARQLTSVDVAA